MESGNSRVGVLGFSFKAGTDDLRESPVIEVIERLIGKGYDLRIYDRNVNIAALVGANRDFILNRIPHISRLMVPECGCGACSRADNRHWESRSGIQSNSAQTARGSVPRGLCSGDSTKITRDQAAYNQDNSDAIFQSY